MSTMTPNQIIAALLDIASAAFSLTHGARLADDNHYTVSREDLVTLADNVFKLNKLPQPEGEPPRTGPAKARYAMQSFLPEGAMIVQRPRVNMDVSAMQEGFRQAAESIARAGAAIGAASSFDPAPRRGEEEPTPYKPFSDNPGDYF